MILVHIMVKVGIVAGCVIIFLITFILNKRTKAPKVDEKIEKCRTCTNESCIIKMSELEEIKKEYELEFEKKSKNSKEENNESNQENNINNNIIDIIDNCHEEETHEK